MNELFTFSYHQFRRTGKSTLDLFEDKMAGNWFKLSYSSNVLHTNDLLTFN